MANHFCSYRDQKAERLVDVLENFERGEIVTWQFVPAGVEFVLVIEYRKRGPVSPIKQMRGAVHDPVAA